MDNGTFPFKRMYFSSNAAAAYTWSTFTPSFAEKPRKKREKEKLERINHNRKNSSPKRGKHWKNWWCATHKTLYFPPICQLSLFSLEKPRDTWLQENKRNRGGSVFMFSLPAAEAQSTFSGTSLSWREDCFFPGEISNEKRGLSVQHAAQESSPGSLSSSGGILRQYFNGIRFTRTGAAVCPRWDCL